MRVKCMSLICSLSFWNGDDYFSFGWSHRLLDLVVGRYVKLVRSNAILPMSKKRVEKKRYTTCLKHINHGFTWSWPWKVNNATFQTSVRFWVCEHRIRKTAKFCRHTMVLKCSWNVSLTDLEPFDLMQSRSRTTCVGCLARFKKCTAMQVVWAFVQYHPAAGVQESLGHWLKDQPSIKLSYIFSCLKLNHTRSWFENFSELIDEWCIETTTLSFLLSHHVLLSLIYTMTIPSGIVTVQSLLLSIASWYTRESRLICHPSTSFRSSPARSWNIRSSGLKRTDSIWCRNFCVRMIGSLRSRHRTESLTMSVCPIHLYERSEDFLMTEFETSLVSFQKLIESLSTCIFWFM